MPAARQPPAENRIRASGRPDSETGRVHGRSRLRLRLMRRYGAQKIREGEAALVVSGSSEYLDRTAEHRAIVDERMKLAILAAGIDGCRQVREKMCVELPARE